MSLADAFAKTDAIYAAQVRYQAFGHLAPVRGVRYPGTMIFCQSEYGDIVCIRADFGDLPDSPWFYEDMQEYIGKKALEAGAIYRFSGYYLKYKNGGYRFSGKVAALDIGSIR